MIRLSNGHEFNFMIGSGGFGYDGWGWPWEKPLIKCGLINPRQFTVVAKTVTLEPRKGNLRWYKPWDCVRLIPDGVVNAVGLTNPGIDWWCRNVGPKVDSSKLPLIGSILGEPEEIAQMTDALNHYDLEGLEVNASCPNTGDDLLANTEKIIRSCHIAANRSRYSIILKLSVAHDIKTIVPAVQGYVGAFSINSVLWDTVFPGKTSPLAHLGGGGVSGKVVQEHTWGLVRKLSQMSSVPVIAPSIWEFEDIAKAQAAGASACSFSSLLLHHPRRPSQIVDQYYFEGN